MTRLGPLTWNVPIVGKDGRPTAEFFRKWNAQASINGTIPALSTSDEVSAVLDLLSSAPGSLLRRGASRWDGLAAPNDATKYLNGAGAYSTPPNTTYGVVTSAAPGLAPTLPNDANKYLNGMGAYSVPAGGGGGGGIDWYGAALATKPLAANFTLGGSTTLPPGAALVDTAAAMNLAATSMTVGLNMAALQTPPATPWTATMLFVVNGNLGLYSAVGIAACDTANSKSVNFLVGNNASVFTRRLDVNRLTGGAYGLNANNSDTAPAFTPPDYFVPSWMRVANDGVNFTFGISTDGVNFRTVFTQASTAFLTTVSKVGPVFICYDTAAAYCALRVLSWSLQ